MVRDVVLPPCFRNFAGFYVGVLFSLCFVWKFLVWKANYFYIFKFLYKLLLIKFFTFLRQETGSYAIYPPVWSKGYQCPLGPYKLPTYPTSQMASRVPRTRVLFRAPCYNARQSAAVRPVRRAPPSNYRKSMLCSRRKSSSCVHPPPCLSLSPCNYWLSDQLWVVFSFRPNQQD